METIGLIVAAIAVGIWGWPALIVAFLIYEFSEGKKNKYGR